MNSKSFQWTEATVNQVIDLWPNSESKAIAEAIGNGCTIKHVAYIVTVIRKENPSLLPKKGNPQDVIGIVKKTLADRP